MKNKELDKERQSEEAIRRAVEDAGGVFRGRDLCCPYCGEKKPSAGIYEDSGVWKYKCHSAGCGIAGDVWDLRARARGMSVDELLAEISKRIAEEARTSRADTPKEVYYQSAKDAEKILRRIGEIESRYVYYAQDRKSPALVVWRIRTKDGKTFRQGSPRAEGWVLKRPEGKTPLYRHEEWHDSDHVVVCEGEKAAMALLHLSIPATTSAMGAGKAGHTDWSSLAGKTVYLWPDNDDAGRDHMQDVERTLEQLDPKPSVRWVDVESLGLPPKGDAADVFDPEQTRTDREGCGGAIRQLLEEATTGGAGQRVGDHVEAIIRGDLECLPWPQHEKLTVLTKALSPGRVTVLCGHAGATKSFFLLQVLWQLHDAGKKVACLMLEDEETDHLLRVLAQAGAEAGMTDMDWIRSHPEEARQISRRHADLITSFGACLTSDPDGTTTRKGALEWVEARAKAGARVIAIDPVTALPSSREPWSDALDLIQSCKRIARKYGASVILTTHPVKQTAKVISMDVIAGGAAYSRFARCIIWMEYLAEMTPYEVTSSMGTVEEEVNRVVWILKASHAKGSGLKVGFEFGPGSLRFREVGVLGDKVSRS